MQLQTMQLQTVRTTVDADGIVTVWLDQPCKSINSITSQMLHDLTEVVGMLEREKPRGVIFASAKQHSFVLGGDLFEISALGPERVTEFLTALTEGAHSQLTDARSKIAGGDWSEETQKVLRDFLENFSADFGYDLDEEGQPLEEAHAA